MERDVEVFLAGFGVGLFIGAVATALLVYLVVRGVKNGSSPAEYRTGAGDK